MIPRRLVRCVPTDTSDEVEQWWREACDLHPEWEHVTWRDPIDPAEFPLTAPYWSSCSSGAQMAGLIRMEDLLHRGGVYIDSDVQLWRPLEPLMGAEAFAAWEDARCVPDAVLAARAGHPVYVEALERAVAELPRGAWYSGPGVTTALFPGRDDVLLLPPGSFYPYHYREKRTGAGRRDLATEQPWSFGAHHWHASWLPPDQRP